MNEQQRAVVQQALEALDSAWGYGSARIDSKLTAAIDGLRQLLEQPEPVQEPAAVTYKEITDTMNALRGGTIKQQQIAAAMESKKLYTTPPAQPAVPLTDLKTLQAIADEYNEWIRHHAAGHDYDDFLRRRAAHGITAAPAQPATEQHLDMVDHGDELTIAYLDGVHTGKKIAKREWVGLTDEEREALILEPDGSAEANVKRVEVLPGAWGKEYDEVDAWSKALILQMLSDHEAKLREKNGGAA